MPTVTEGKLLFTFDNRWTVAHYDANGGFYRRKLEKLPSALKAVDILAYDDNNNFLWIEVKDCRDFSQENQYRYSDTPPPELFTAKTYLKDKGWDSSLNVSVKKPSFVKEVAKKVSDTLLGLSVAHRLDDNDIVPFLPPSQQTNLTVVFFLSDQATDFKRKASSLRLSLNKQLVKFLPSVNVAVCNEDTVPEHLNFTVNRSAFDDDGPVQQDPL